MNNIEQDVAAAVAGDRDAFGRLYDRYVRDIHDFLYYKTHHLETAQDLTSQTFMKALRSIDGFANDRASFRTWLYAIARNTVIDHYRKQRPQTAIEDAFEIPSDSDVERDAHLSQMMDQIQPLLSTLSSEQREIILLRLWQGKSYAEIAEIVGKSEGACKVAFSRSMKQLRLALPSLAAFFVLLYLSV